MGKNESAIKVNDLNNMASVSSITVKVVATSILVEVLKRCHLQYSLGDIGKICEHYFEDANSEMDLSNLEFDELENVIFSLLTDGIDFDSKKKSGSEGTPIEIVDYMIDSMGYEGEYILDKTIIDPACGTGVFVSRVMRKYLSTAMECGYENIYRNLCGGAYIKGFDTKESNVFCTKIICILEMLRLEILNSIDDVVEYYSLAPFYCEDFLFSDQKADYVIGNPPYIRLQNLEYEYRASIKDGFKSATGRFDIYVCFMEKSCELLNEGGKVCLITSNKYLTANYGLGIRKYLSEKLYIQQVMDLFDTKFFNAAVLPAIIVCVKEKNSSKKKSRYIEMKTSKKKPDRICDTAHQVFELTRVMQQGERVCVQKRTNDNSGVYSISCSDVIIPTNGKAWNFAASEETSIKEKLEDEKMCLLGDMVDICVGVKSTADSVFVKPMTEEFVTSSMIEKELVYPLIQSFDVDRWKINWGKSSRDRYILYPHCESNGEMHAVEIKQYPNAYRYIMQNEKVLKSRNYLLESKTRQWYECWVPQSLSKFRKPKLVTRDIVSHNSFAFDNKGMICQGNTFFLTRKDARINGDIADMNDQDFFYYLLGILNTKVMECYQKIISGCLYSKKYRYTTTNLQRWPIPVASKDDALEIANIAKKIEQGLLDKEDGEAVLNQKVDNLFGLNDNEIRTVEDYLYANT